MPDPDQPGFKNILLRPIFPAGLDQSEVTHRSPYGEIVSSWKRNKKTIVYDIQIPANSTAKFYPPENVEGSGDAVRVMLSGVPEFARDRSFRGYRGFGLIDAQVRIPVSPPPVAAAETEPEREPQQSSGPIADIDANAQMASPLHLAG